MVNVFTENDKQRRRGRPAGRTAEGEATRTRVYEIAIALIGQRGYDAATLREVAERAGVSVGLLYRYFPSKQAVVLALYDELSLQFAEEAAAMPRGKWGDRFLFAVELSLKVLWPHRGTLRALAGVIVGDVKQGIFAEATAFSRTRVQAAFESAVTGATDAPKNPLAQSLGRLLYFGHLGLILWWLSDRSKEQRATRGLVMLLGQVLPLAAQALRLSPVKHFVQSADALLMAALIGEEAAVADASE